MHKLSNHSHRAPIRHTRRPNHPIRLLRANNNSKRAMSTHLKPENFPALQHLHPDMPSSVTINEVGPRDGLQNVPGNINAFDKTVFINKLNHTGLKVIEAGSFVHPKWVPQMASSDIVLKNIDKMPGIEYPVLTPNLQGFNRALECGVTEIAVFASASEAFSQKNLNCSIEESLERFEPIFIEAKARNIKIRGYVSCVIACPYSGEVKPDDVARIAHVLYQKGCAEISLGDTIGVATPGTTTAMLNAVMKVVPKENIAVHFHDTFGMGMANVMTSLQLGIKSIDASIGGIGGCPYAGPAASGNIDTIALVYMLNGMGIKSGVSYEKLLETTDFLSTLPLKMNSSHVIVHQAKNKTAITNCKDQKSARA